MIAKGRALPSAIEAVRAGFRSQDEDVENEKPAEYRYEDEEPPPEAPTCVMKAAACHGEVGQEQGEAREARDRAALVIAEQRIDEARDRADEKITSRKKYQYSDRDPRPEKVT